jgi:hypothetical protein
MGPAAIDATRLLRRLYIGSKPPLGSHLADAGFDVVVFCADDIQPPSILLPGVIVLHAGIDDSYHLSSRERSVVVSAARAAARHVKDGRRVLITCRQGRNRSGLVSALAIHFLTGMSGKRAARHVQDMRVTRFGPALSNDYFVDLLCEVPPVAMAANGAQRRAFPSV